MKNQEKDSGKAWNAFKETATAEDAAIDYVLRGKMRSCCVTTCDAAMRLSCGVIIDLR